jgi:hypothetical protein
MATIKQMEANRRNAQKSTGPRTAAGKAAVRMNALRHGLRARTVVLPSENRDEFHQLCDDLEIDWQPQSRTEQFYLEQMAVSQWKLTRMEVSESDVRGRFEFVEEQLPLLDRLWQTQCRLERSYARAQRELERLQKARRPVDQPDVEVPATQPAAKVHADPESASPKPVTSPGAPPAAVPGAPVFPRAEADPRQRRESLPSLPETLDSGPQLVLK